MSEKDIRRDENVKLVTNRDELPTMQLGQEDSNIKTMYGTFNKDNQDLPVTGNPEYMQQ